MRVVGQPQCAGRDGSTDEQKQDDVAEVAATEPNELAVVLGRPADLEAISERLEPLGEEVDRHLEHRERGHRRDQRPVEPDLVGRAEGEGQPVRAFRPGGEAVDEEQREVPEPVQAVRGDLRCEHPDGQA